MFYHGTAGRGLILLFVYFLTAGVFVATGTLLPEGLFREVATVGLAVLVAVIYLVVLVRRIRNVFAGRGHFSVEVVLALVNLSVLLLAFAAVYARIGLGDTTGSSTAVSHHFGHCFYYSVVTFTTLGYGDFYPRGTGRVLAALEAFVGFAVLGIIASTSAQIIQSVAKEQEED